MKPIAKRSNYDLITEASINLEEIVAKVTAVKAMMSIVETRYTCNIIDKTTKTCKGCKYVSAKLEAKSNANINMPCIFCSRMFSDKYESAAEGGKE